MCVGEHLEEREAGRTADVIRAQFEGSFADISAEQMQKTLIAYEPVWAIGTGKVATPAQAEEVHADLRKLIEVRYNPEVASAVRIQYGGSVKASNSAELMSQPNIDGALVGGASLVADDFLGIIASCKWSDDFMNPFLAILMILTAIFLILLVLIQRGRGGGLAGAFGGMGGQSAFGTKAGDLFTRITIGVAAFWIVLCIVTLKLTVNRGGSVRSEFGPRCQRHIANAIGTRRRRNRFRRRRPRTTRRKPAAARQPAPNRNPAKVAATAPADSGSKGAEKSSSTK